MADSVKVKDIGMLLPDKISHFIVCGSFEDRCRTVLDNVPLERIAHSSVFFFKEFFEESADNIEALKIGLRADTYEMSYIKPISVADAFMEAFSCVNDDEKGEILVDISTFTRESLLVLIAYLYKRKGDFKDVIFLYRCAKVVDGLSGMVTEVRTVLGFMGKISPIRPIHLVVLSGFEYERAREIIDRVEPDFISIGFGADDESIFQDHYERNIAFTKKLKAYYPSEMVCEFSYSLKDPAEASKAISSQASKYPDCNVVVAPLNNKISTIGAGLSAIYNNRMQLIYAPVDSYNHIAYSDPQDSCILFKLSDLDVHP